MTLDSSETFLQNHPKILIIDDDSHFLFGVSRVLMKAEFDVTTAPEGMTGIEKAKTDLPDLILLDINMPTMTGFQVKKVLDSSLFTRSIPVVFLTALNSHLQCLSGLELADDYITKPVDPDILIARVKSILRRVNTGYRLALQEVSHQIFTPEKFQQWGHAVEIHDFGTAGHTLRVAQWALTLAKSMGITGDDLESIYKGAMLHDIGKLAIPAHVLNKPGALDDEEWKIMREHPTLGYKMLSALNKLPQSVLDIPFYHHERWDGLGYPTGLSKTDIPISARIFSIVDVMDALLSKRAYKKSLEEDEALNIIRAQSGTYFDPEIVDHFLSNFVSLKQEVANEWAKNNPGY